MAHTDGRGLPRDPEGAFFWHSVAAELGHPEAMAHLAQAYETGSGVKRNPQEAARWRQQAERANAASVER